MFQIISSLSAPSLNYPSSCVLNTWLVSSSTLSVTNSASVCSWRRTRWKSSPQTRRVRWHVSTSKLYSLWRSHSSEPCRRMSKDLNLWGSSYWACPLKETHHDVFFFYKFYLFLFFYLVTVIFFQQVGIRVKDGGHHVSLTVNPPESLCDGKFHLVTGRTVGALGLHINQNMLNSSVMSFSVWTGQSY